MLSSKNYPVVLDTDRAKAKDLKFYYPRLLYYPCQILASHMLPTMACAIIGFPYPNCQNPRFVWCSIYRVC